METTQPTTNLAYIRNKGVKSLSVKMGFLAGSRFEPAARNGVAHLTEHLVIASSESICKTKQVNNGNNNTENRIKTKLDPFNFVSELDGATYHESMIFWANSTNDYTDKILDYFTNLTQIKDFSDEIFSSEKNAVLGAALQHESLGDAYERLNDYIFECVFGADNPMSKNPVGSSIDCKNLSKDDCLMHYNQFIKNKPSSIVIYGDIGDSDIAQFCDLMESPKPEDKQNPDIKEVLSQKHTIHRLEFGTQTPETAFVYLFVTDDFKDSVFLEFVGFVLGKSVNSILYKQLRENKKIAYDTHTRINSYTDVTLFSIYCGLSNTIHIETLLNIIPEITNKIETFITPEEFEIFKMAFAQKSVISQENPNSIVNEVLNRLQSGRSILSNMKINREIKGVEYSWFCEFVRESLTVVKAQTLIVG